MRPKQASSCDHLHLGLWPNRGVEESVELHNRLEPKLLRALEMIAPGSFIREGIDEVLQGGTGALIIIGEPEELAFMFCGGIKIDLDYQPAMLYQSPDMMAHRPQQQRVQDRLGQRPADARPQLSTPSRPAPATAPPSVSPSSPTPSSSRSPPGARSSPFTSTTPST